MFFPWPWTRPKFHTWTILQLMQQCNLRNFMQLYATYATMQLIQLYATICNKTYMQLYATICNKTYAALQLYATIWRIGPKALFFLSSHGTHLETYSYYENVPMVPNATNYMQLNVCNYTQLCNYATCNLWMTTMQLYATMQHATNYMQLRVHLTICNYATMQLTICN